MKLKRKLGLATILAIGSVASIGSIGLCAVSCSSDSKSSFTNANNTLDADSPYANKFVKANLDQINSNIWKNNSILTSGKIYESNEKGTKTIANLSNQTISTSLKGSDLVIDINANIQANQIVSTSSPTWYEISTKAQNMPSEIKVTTKGTYDLKYQYDLGTHIVTITNEITNPEMFINGNKIPADTTPDLMPNIENPRPKTLTPEEMTADINNLYIQGYSETVDLTAPGTTPKVYMKTFDNTPSYATFNYGYRSNNSSAITTLSEIQFNEQVKNLFDTRVIMNTQDMSPEEQQQLQEMINNGSHYTYYYVVRQDKLYAWVDAQIYNPKTKKMEKMFNHTTISLVASFDPSHRGLYECINLTTNEDGSEPEAPEIVWINSNQLRDILNDFASYLHP